MSSQVNESLKRLEKSRSSLFFLWLVAELASINCDCNYHACLGLGIFYFRNALHVLLENVRTELEALLPFPALSSKHLKLLHGYGYIWLYMVKFNVINITTPWFIDLFPFEHIYTRMCLFDKARGLAFENCRIEATNLSRWKFDVFFGSWSTSVIFKRFKWDTWKSSGECGLTHFSGCQCLFSIWSTK